MNLEMIIVFSILTLTVILFASDRLRLDVVALMAVLLLLLTGILTPAEALAGFSDPIVLIIAGLFIVGAGLFQTGVADALGQQLVRLAGTGEARLIVAIMLIVAFLSAFLSSTGTVAVFLPVVVSLAQRTGISPTKLLLPLAYASLIGGMLTLIGTPPNIVVSNQLQSAGMTPFGFFSFTPVGAVMLMIGIAYMATVGRRLLPERAHLSGASRDGKTLIDPATLLALYDLPGKLARVQIEPASPVVGLGGNPAKRPLPARRVVPQVIDAHQRQARIALAHRAVRFAQHDDARFLQGAHHGVLARPVVVVAQHGVHAQRRTHALQRTPQIRQPMMRMHIVADQQNHIRLLRHRRLEACAGVAQARLVHKVEIAQHSNPHRLRHRRRHSHPAHARPPPHYKPRENQRYTQQSQRHNPPPPSHQKQYTRPSSCTSRRDRVHL